MAYDFLIFDLDGTIVDSQKDITFAVNSVRKDFGFEPLTIEKVRSYLGSGVKALVDKVVPEKSDEILKAALEKFKHHYAKCLTDTTVPYEGIEKTLKALKGKKKAILSNKTELFSCEILKRLELSKYFLEIWGGDTAGVKKPDPKPILDLIKITKADPRKTIMIGDSGNDFKAAKAAGVASLAVLYGYSDIAHIKQYNPDYIVSCPEEIVKIVS
jgi:haloacid dehalogenase superfamily, subfamily IA, variant 3 with third motif having DD or ED/haloacid dehalogenase superfamily, subfamily IA, variant 1 with third motif having Dx(3-4)D or Dx(3-4)E